jgi:hypothetical protein
VHSLILNDRKYLSLYFILKGSNFMKFTAKKFISLVFAASLLAAAMPLPASAVDGTISYDGYIDGNLVFMCQLNDPVDTGTMVVVEVIRCPMGLQRPNAPLDPKATWGEAWESIDPRYKGREMVGGKPREVFIFDNPTGATWNTVITVPVTGAVEVTVRMIIIPFEKDFPGFIDRTQETVLASETQTFKPSPMRGGRIAIAVAKV